MRAIPPVVPNPTEGYEGIGDAMVAVVRFALGAAQSFVDAVGFAMSIWVACRQVSARGAEPIAAPDRGEQG